MDRHDLFANHGATELSADELLVDLRRSFRIGGVSAVVDDVDGWSGPPRGWSDPTLDHERGVFTVRFCPEVIHAVIGRLHGAALRDVLVTIKAAVFLAVSHHDRDDPRTSVDDRLWDDAPGTLRLLSEIELAALDRSGEEAAAP